MEEEKKNGNFQKNKQDFARYFYKTYFKENNIRFPLLKFQEFMEELFYEPEEEINISDNFIFYETYFTKLPPNLFYKKYEEDEEKKKIYNTILENIFLGNSTKNMHKFIYKNIFQDYVKKEEKKLEENVTKLEKLEKLEEEMKKTKKFLKEEIDKFEENKKDISNLKKDIDLKEKELLHTIITQKEKVKKKINEMKNELQKLQKDEEYKKYIKIKRLEKESKKYEEIVQTNQQFLNLFQTIFQNMYNINGNMNINTLGPFYSGQEDIGQASNIECYDVLKSFYDYPNILSGTPVIIKTKENFKGSHFLIHYLIDHDVKHYFKKSKSPDLIYVDNILDKKLKDYEKEYKTKFNKSIDIEIKNQLNYELFILFLYYAKIKSNDLIFTKDKFHVFNEKNKKKLLELPNNDNENLDKHFKDQDFIFFILYIYHYINIFKDGIFSVPLNPDSSNNKLIKSYSNLDTSLFALLLKQDKESFNLINNDHKAIRVKCKQLQSFMLLKPKKKIKK